MELVNLHRDSTPPASAAPDDGPLIHGAGTPDAVWLAWPGLAALPAVGASGLVAPGARAVLVAPHPDDEVLACGGLLQMLATRAGELVLVAVTDGDASHPHSTVWPAERLRAVRPRETAAALAALGLPGAARLTTRRAGLPDGAVAAHEAALQALLERQLRPGDVVLSTWRLDGHPDHEACGRAAAAAAQRCGATLIELPVWTWHWACPADARVPWQRAHRLALTPDQLQRKRDALAGYHSQLTPDPSTGAAPILPPSTLARLLHRDEIYFL